MQLIRKKLVTDEDRRPVAVQIEYSDWLKIELQLGFPVIQTDPVDLSRHAGTLKRTESPLAYQARCRSEWS